MQCVWEDPIFKPGDIVQAVATCQWNLTEGKEYEVIKYIPPCYDPIFAWPAYVTVIGDVGKEFTCHTYRFKLKQP